MTSEEPEALRKRDALALAQLIYDIYVEQKDSGDEINVTQRS